MRQPMVTKRKRMRLRPAMVTRRESQGLRAGLQSYWKMEEADSAIRLDSVQNHDLDQTEGVTQEVGKIGFGAGFDGVDQYLSNVDADFRMPSVAKPAFTVAGWFFVAGDPGDERVICALDDTGLSSAEGSRGWYLTYNANSSIIQFAYSTNSTSIAANVTVHPSKPPLDQWVFFCLRYDLAATTLKFRLNGGADVTDTAVTVTTACTSPFSIGMRSNNFPNAFGEWVGRFDEIGEWDRVITDAECTTLRNGGSGITFPFQVVDRRRRTWDGRQRITADGAFRIVE